MYFFVIDRGPRQVLIHQTTPGHVVGRNGLVMNRLPTPERLFPGQRTSLQVPHQLTARSCRFAHSRLAMPSLKTSAATSRKIPARFLRLASSEDVSRHMSETFRTASG